MKQLSRLTSWTFFCRIERMCYHGPGKCFELQFNMGTISCNQPCQVKLENISDPAHRNYSDLPDSVKFLLLWESTFLDCTTLTSSDRPRGHLHSRHGHGAQAETVRQWEVVSITLKEGNGLWSWIREASLLSYVLIHIITSGWHYSVISPAESDRI